jgi:hypothetical protein
MDAKQLKEKLIDIFDELGYEPVINKCYGNKKVIKIKMWEATADSIHDLQDVISYFYLKLGEYRLRLKGSLDVHILKDLDVCIEYSVETKFAEEDLETLKVLLEN